MSAVDTAQLDLMFTELRLPTFKAAWAQLAQRADAEGWPAARLLGALAEQEIADRARRRFGFAIHRTYGVVLGKQKRPVYTYHFGTCWVFQRQPN